MISQCRGSSSSLAKTAETIEISGRKVPFAVASIRNKLSLTGSSQNLARISCDSFKRSVYGTPRGVANAVSVTLVLRSPQWNALVPSDSAGVPTKIATSPCGFRRMLQTCVTPSLIGCLPICCCFDVGPDYWSDRDGRDPVPAIPSDCRQTANVPANPKRNQIGFAVEPLPAGRPSRHWRPLAGLGPYARFAWRQSEGIAGTGSRPSRSDQ